MTTAEALRDYLSTFPIHHKLKRSEIVAEVAKKYSKNQTSIIPSDYCYNLTNDGFEGTVYLKQPHFFLSLGNGEYEYLGENADYTGNILNNRNEIKGNWESGVCILMEELSLELKKVDTVWLAAAISTFEVCSTKQNWELEDICFQQAKIQSDAEKLIGDVVPATLVSQQCCANTQYSVYNYLASNDKSRRISYFGEFSKIKERPAFEDNRTVKTNVGNITFHELCNFIDEEYTPKVISLIASRYDSLNFELMFHYIEEYAGKRYIAVESAGERAEEMQELKSSGTAAREMLTKVTGYISSYMSKFSKADISNWINQGQTVNRYLWTELRKSGKEKSPSSLSIFIEKNAGNFELRVSVEAHDSQCSSADYIKHNRLLDIQNTNPQLNYYVTGDKLNELVIFPSSISDLKEDIELGKYKKVQLCRAIARADLKLMSGSEIMSFIFVTLNDLEPFYDLAVSEMQTSLVPPVEMDANFSKNTILYGPPGTGKTYNSIKYAVAIIENKPLAEIEKEQYAQVKVRYETYKSDGLIEFTTFHQSFGYEEFIEGIRPVFDKTEDTSSDIEYSIHSGVFKAFCEKAEAATVGNSANMGISENPTIWKVSLQGTGDNPVRSECMAGGHIRIGWDGYGENIDNEANYKDGGKGILNAFINNMQKGDVVLSCYSENEIDAIGVVTGEYEWAPKYDYYKRVRKVNWLVKGIKEDIRDINGKRMTLSTVYRLNNLTLTDVLAIVSKYKPVQDADKRNRVFIIDEINRGNISKIFGELITLIEPSKRLGQTEATRVKLPYSPKPFGVPDNLYIIGTMNTADRSIALIDTALRRRFHFIEMQPDPSVLDGIDIEGIRVSGMLMKMNRRIEVLCDREHTLGHAYFTSLSDKPTMEQLACIFEYTIIPLLQEYFYEDYEKIRLVLGDNNKPAVSQFITKEEIEYSNLFGDTDYPFTEASIYRINRSAFRVADAYLGI